MSPDDGAGIQDADTVPRPDLGSKQRLKLGTYRTISDLAGVAGLEPAVSSPPNLAT
jgi:hypothetical protein